MEWISPENPNEKIRVNPLEGSGTVIFPQNQEDLINNEINDDINSVNDNKGGLISDSFSFLSQISQTMFTITITSLVLLDSAQDVLLHLFWEI